MKLLSGEQTAPAWLRAYNFHIYIETPTMAPPLIPTPPSPNSTVDQNGNLLENDVFEQDGTIIQCEGCTINLGPSIAPTVATQPPTPTTNNYVTKQTRPRRTRPWPYHGMVQDEPKWPWFMGPPPEGIKCENPPCKLNTNWFRRRKRRQAPPPMPPGMGSPTVMPTPKPDNLDKFGLVSFIMPPGLEFGDFPVPESCCAVESQYCGLKNDFSYNEPPVPVYPNFTNFNMTLLENYTTPEVAPIEPIIDNIFTQGCYTKFQTAEILKSTQLDHYLLFYSVFNICLYFLFLLFTLLLYFDCSLVDQRYTRRYGQPVKISRTL